MHTAFSTGLFNLECPICLDEMNPKVNQEIYAFLCGHRIHLTCARESERYRGILDCFFCKPPLVQKELALLPRPHIDADTLRARIRIAYQDGYQNTFEYAYIPVIILIFSYSILTKLCDNSLPNPFLVGMICFVGGWKSHEICQYKVIRVTVGSTLALMSTLIYFLSFTALRQGGNPARQPIEARPLLILPLRIAREQPFTLKARIRADYNRAYENTPQILRVALPTFMCAYSIIHDLHHGMPNPLFIIAILLVGPNKSHEIGQYRAARISVGSLAALASVVTYSVTRCINRCR